MSAPLLPVAETLVASGLSVIPIGSLNTKAPDGPLLPRRHGTNEATWEPFQKRLATHDELRSWFGPAAALAVVAGMVSGNLTIMDFDTKYSGQDLYDQFIALVQELVPDLIDSLPLVRTPSGGWHLYFRSTVVGQPDKLARSPTGETWIETKAQGGYCLAPLSTGYRTMRGSLTAVPVITAEAWELLLNCGRSFDAHVPTTGTHYRTDEKPGVVFNAKMTLDDMQRWLTAAGWVHVHTRQDGTQLLRRPGKREGISATLGRNGLRSLYVFSSNAAPFEQHESYSAFGVITQLEHGGDYRAAARALAAAGYGAKPAAAQEHAAPAVEVAVPAPEVAPREWPRMRPEAFSGLAGDIVRLVAPHTEADPVAVLANTLVFFGNAVNHRIHARAGGARHTLNEFVGIVGDTSKARKGGSVGPISELFDRVDPIWARERIVSGLSSGEGLINAVRDASDKADKDGIPLDEGVQDKRLLVVEEELASVLTVMAREGNTLSAILRKAWDSGEIRTLTKSPIHATNAHISIIGHITRLELERSLTATEAANGFANRFLWLCSRRSKRLPEGGGDWDFGPVVGRLHDALDFARGCTTVLRRGEEARVMWAEIYGDLSEGKPGLLGAVLSRAEAHVLRLSSLYAALDRSPLVGATHLTAALAFWEYCEASAHYIFGDRLGDPIADTILEALTNAGADGLDRTAISNLFGRHQQAGRIQTALDQLLAANMAAALREKTGGAPRTIYRRAVG